MLNWRTPEFKHTRVQVLPEHAYECCGDGAASLMSLTLCVSYRCSFSRVPVCNLDAVVWLLLVFFYSLFVFGSTSYFCNKDTDSIKIYFDTKLIEESVVPCPCITGNILLKLYRRHCVPVLAHQNNVLQQWNNSVKFCFIKQYLGPSPGAAF
jgi:hypothetical protein